MRKHDHRTSAPVFKVDLRAVFAGDRVHGAEFLSAVRGLRFARSWRRPYRWPQLPRRPPRAVLGGRAAAGEGLFMSLSVLMLARELGPGFVGSALVSPDATVPTSSAVLSRRK